MDLFPKYSFYGMGHWALGTDKEETYPPLPLKWKKRCEETSQRFFQEGIMDILCP
ncbi:MAG: hypothetical protein V7K24_01405 [Nostoc sp.]